MVGRDDGCGRRRLVVAALVGILAAAAVQSLLHLYLALDAHRMDTVLDLDRSNGIPDILSTLALGAACAGATRLRRPGHGSSSRVVGLLACVLALLTLADLVHDGAHPSDNAGLAVIGLGFTAVGLLLVVAARSSGGTRVILAFGLAALLGAFVVPGLDRFDRWFERARGDPVREYQIVVKEDLELIGWSLAALALWYEASLVSSRTTKPASRAQAAPRRRGA